jgi:glutamate N-acetyltransferase/amino-acid N-acetyltransferase
MKPNSFDNIYDIDGGITAAAGIAACGIYAGIRKNASKLDMALISAPAGAIAAGVFTQNKFAAAPVKVSLENLKRSESTRAIIINSGNANAATGDVGLANAHEMTAAVAAALGIDESEVLVASTGVIGVPMPMPTVLDGIEKAASALGFADGKDAASDLAAGENAASGLTDGLAAASAIMTTDTVAKQAAVTFDAVESDGTPRTYHIGGMAKGSGMIEPHLATMIGVLTTDCMLTPVAIDEALRMAVANTFNKVTIDSDSSTNDTVFLLASGGIEGKTLNENCPVFPLFVEALRRVCESLARQIAADGEGATKLVTVNVKGAASELDADEAARAVANSPLVKTAIAGHDANWGRVAMAIGKSKASFEQENVSIRFMGLPVCENGCAVAFDEDEALRRFEQSEIVIDIDLGAGDAKTTVWTCDLTHDYISINGDYRT